MLLTIEGKEGLIHTATIREMKKHNKSCENLRGDHFFFSESC